MELINECNEKFLEISKKINQRLEQIKLKYKLDDTELLKGREVIVEPGTFSYFCKDHLNDLDEEIVNDLKELISFTSIAKFFFSLDSLKIALQLGELYNNLMDEILSKSFQIDLTITTILEDTLNKFNYQFTNQIIPYEIIIPLKGINYMDPSYSDEGVMTFVSNNSNYENIFENRIELKYFPEMGILRKDGSVFRLHNRTFSEEKIIMKTIAILAKSFVSFEFEDNIGNNEVDPPKIPKYFGMRLSRIENSKLWKIIKKVFASFLISNYNIGFGRPFYEFPWWISKSVVKYFNFPEPDWMIKRKFSKFQSTQFQPLFHEFVSIGLIPDFDPTHSHLIPFRQHVFSTNQCVWTSPAGLAGLSRVTQESQGHQNFKFKTLLTNFNTLSDRNRAINFAQYGFIFDRLIHLRQREHVEDAIIDACLIIETLLLPPYGESLSYQFRLRSSLMIANYPDEAKECMNYFNKLYDLRSKIVHGKKKWHQEYMKFVEVSVRKRTNENLKKYKNNPRIYIEKSKDKVIDLLVIRIIRIISRAIEVNESFPEYFDNIKNIINLSRKICE